MLYPALHDLVSKLMTAGADVPLAKTKAGESWFDKQVKQLSADFKKNPEWSRLQELHVRKAWEETIELKYMAKFVSGYKGLAPILDGRWRSSDDQSGAIIAELREGFNISALPRCYDRPLEMT